MAKVSSTSEQVEAPASQVRVKLVRSLLGRPKKQLRTVKALGLRKTNDEVIKFDTPTIRGMIQKVTHLIQVEPVVV